MNIRALQYFVKLADLRHFSKAADACFVSQPTLSTQIRKLEEARIAEQEGNGMLQVGSYAAIPEQSLESRRMVNTAAAAAMGLILGTIAAFAIEFWRQDRPVDEDSTG